MRRASLMRSAAFAAALAVGAVVGSGAAQAVSISNGSFEFSDATVPSTPATFVTLTGGSTAINDWVVGGSSIDYIGGYWQPQQGERSLDLNGLGVGSISQQLTGLTVGNIYKVSFYMAGNPDNDHQPNPKDMDVTASAGSSSFSFDVTGKSLTNMGWELKEFSFTALTSSTTLAFTSTTNNEGCPCFGPALDNVAILDAGHDPNFTPLPAAVWLLGSVLAGGAGFGRWRKRKAKNAALVAA